MRAKVNYLNKCFSLIELMAVVAIVAILVAVAVPTYRSYQIQAKLVEVVNVLDTVLDQARQQYVSAGTIPTSVSGLTSGTFTAYTSSPYIAFIKYDNGSSWNNVGHAAMVQAIVSTSVGNGIPGFAAGTSGAYNTVTMAFVASGDVMTNYCGSWVDNGTQVPLALLPTGCRSDAFQTSVTG